MAIKKRIRPANRIGHRSITAGTKITANAHSTQRINKPKSRISIMASKALAELSPEKRAFANQLQSTYRSKASVMAATNTSNIAARPEFMELLPIFVQKLLILDIFGSVAMKSRQQIIPYFKFIAENTKGETQKGDILSSPMVNRQGHDPNFTGRVVKNELVENAEGIFTTATLAYIPVLPGSVTLSTNLSGVSTPYTDDGLGNLLSSTGSAIGKIDYASGAVTITGSIILSTGDTVKATYQYDNETVGPDVNGEYGARMAKGYLDLDEITLEAKAHDIACYWSIFSAFAAQQEYGANISDMSKEAAFAELTAEINTQGFDTLKKAATFNPAFNWDVAPIQSGSVVPSDYCNMFKLKLNQAAASVYQKTQLGRPNRLIVGTNVESFIKMVNGFSAENTSDNVGPYKVGKLDEFEIFCDPNYDPNEWVMTCKSDDIRRNSALFGEYMPFVDTASIGLANASVQQGYATMYAMKVVNPATIVSGRILGTF